MEVANPRSGWGTEFSLGQLLFQIKIEKTDPMITAGKFFVVLTLAFQGSNEGPIKPPLQSREGQEIERPAEIQKRDELIANLKKMYEESNDKRRKQRVASNLVFLGVEDDRYFEYVAHFARQTLEKEMPYPISMEIDESGKRGYSKEFLDWAREQDIDPDSVAYEAGWEGPSNITLLANTADPRAYDLLVSALQSPNILIVAQAVRGLGWIGDERAIPLILEAARKAPEGIAAKIASGVLYFDDLEAHREARKFFPSEEVFQAFLKEAQRMPKKR